MILEESIAGFLMFCFAESASGLTASLRTSPRLKPPFLLLLNAGRSPLPVVIERRTVAVSIAVECRAVAVSVIVECGTVAVVIVAVKSGTIAAVVVELRSVAVISVAVKSRGGRRCGYC